QLFDSNGNPHISYESYMGLKHAWWDGKQWHTQMIRPSSGNSFFESFMTIDRNDNLYISFKDPADGSLKIAVGRPTQAVQTAPDVLPRVTLLISAYNEEAVIGEKLRNALSLDYPRGFLEIIVVSDCSDDGTDEIVREFAPRAVRLVRQAERLGKSSGLNLGVLQASGEILVFSDANAMYEPDALRWLVRH